MAVAEVELEVWEPLVLALVLVDLLLRFHGLLVERVVLVGNGFVADFRVEEIFADSILVELGRLGCPSCGSRHARSCLRERSIS